LRLVFDASVALKWVLDEPGRDAADRLLDEDLIAPSLWLVEAANALWRRAQRGELSPAQAAARLMELRNAPVATIPLEDDVVAAASIAIELGHPVYACLYLALAIRENTYVVTADRRFRDAVVRSDRFRSAIRLLGDDA
jgi:predicted nucleic acid-binding protein